MSFGYLPHVDGLRALAFIFVLLFHFRIAGARGGYLGVDMFLVLSGFLMTRIIDRDVRAGTFKMRDFMIRRFWRLYPSLLVTVAMSLATSLLLFSPKLQRSVGASSLAALLFGSNHYFHATTGYFDIGSELKPLLHTWSLSLEEQFYFVWPLYIGLVHRALGGTRSNLSSALMFIFIASFVFVAALKDKASHSLLFFLLPSRVFEFAAGGILSIFYTNLAEFVENAKSQDFIGIAGAVLVSYPVFSAPESTEPGFSSLPTLLGTMFLILARDSLLAKHVMSAPLVRFIGKISYAGYLVHWPIWVFAMFVSDPVDEGGLKTIMLLFAATFALAIIVHYSVEVNLRYKRATGVAIVVISLLAATLIVALSSLISNGFPNRALPVDVNILKDAWTYSDTECAPIPRNHSLWAKLDAASIPPRACYIGVNIQPETTATLPISAVLVGSSFAYHLVHGFRLLAKQRNESYLVLSHESCPLITTERYVWPWVLESCFSENTRRMNFLRTLAPTKLLLADHWDARFHEGQHNGADALEGPQGAFRYMRRVERDLAQLGHRLAVVGDPPVIGERAFERILSCDLLREQRARRVLSRLIHVQERCAVRFKPHARQVDTNTRLRRHFNERNVDTTYLDQFPSFCDDRTCMVSLPNPAHAVAPDGVNVTKRGFFEIHWEGVHLDMLGAWHASPGLSVLLDTLKGEGGQTG